MYIAIIVVGIVCFLAGAVLMKIYGSAVLSKIQTENEALKASAKNAIDKL